MTYPATPEMMPEPEDLARHVWCDDHHSNEMVEDQTWEPGEPIWLGAGNYIRQMFQVLPDVQPSTWSDFYWCHACDVMWGWWDGDPADAPCWICGQPTACPNDEKEQMLRFRFLKEW